MDHEQEEIAILRAVVAIERALTVIVDRPVPRVTTSAAAFYVAGQSVRRNGDSYARP